MKRWAIAAIALGSISLPLAGTGAASAAAAPTVTFSIKGAPAGSSVLFVGIETAKKVSLSARKIQLPASFRRRGDSVYRFSVHFLAADGRYLGPTVFNIAGTKKWTTNVIAKKTMKIGSLSFKSAGWAKSSVKLGRGQFGKVMSGAGKDGKPKGAGRIGVVFKSGVSANGVHESAATCSMDLDQTLGGDCDADGVLNAVDADDDNDGVMDVADKSTEDFPAAGWTPTAGIRAEVGGAGSAKTLNANLNTATLDSDIDNMLGGTDATFTLSFFFNLDNTEANSYDAGWVDCGGLEYCNSTTGAATTGPTSTPMNPYFNQFFCKETNTAGWCNHKVLWREFTGYRVVNGVAAKAEDKGYGITNGMQFSASPEGTMWAGAMIPVGVTNPREKFKVGDPYLAKMRSAADGSVKTVPMSLGAYFVTHPAIVKVNNDTIDYATALPKGASMNPYPVPENGVLDMWMYRPQRTAIDGSDPAGSKYMDMGGLDYGFAFEADPQITEKVIKSRSIDSRLFGCGNKSAYTPAAPVAEVPNDSTGGGDLWNLHDSSVDAVPAVDRMIHITLDFKKCISSQSAKLFVDPVRFAESRKVQLQFHAAGANTSGGRSGSIQTIYVELPAVATTWAVK